MFTSDDTSPTRSLRYCRQALSRRHGARKLGKISFDSNVLVLPTSSDSDAKHQHLCLQPLHQGHKASWISPRVSPVTHSHEPSTKDIDHIILSFTFYQSIQAVDFQEPNFRMQGVATK
jgi:hypothetical protein